MSTENTGKKHKLKRLSLKPIRFLEALKMAVNVDPEELKKIEEEEKKQVETTEDSPKPDKAT